MKNSKLLFGAIVALSIGLTSCSDDAPTSDNGNGVVDSDQTRYLKIAISNPQVVGRAEDNDFVDGTDTENDVKSLNFIFYDRNGNRIDAQTNVEGFNFNNDKSDNQYPSVGKFAEAIVSINLVKGQNSPAYVMCFINPQNFDEFGGATTKVMSDLRDAERYSYKNDATGFSMSNSAYYGTDNVTSAPNVKITGTPLTQGQFFPSYDSANESDDDSRIINIYVERYAAKVNFTLNTTESENTGVKDYEVNGYNLTFVPQGWTVNADANSMFAIKKFSADKDGVIPTKSDIDNYFGYTWAWNDEAKKRSYWGCSTSFYATEFPQVSDNIMDQLTDGTTGAGKLVGDYKLKYYSFNQITNPNSEGYVGVSKWNNETNVIGEPENVRYVLENTMGKAAFASLNPRAAAPSVILAGRYKLTNSANNSEISENTTFYLFHQTDNKYNVYFDAVPTNAADYAKTIVDAMLDVQGVLYISNPDASTQAAIPYVAIRSTNANTSLKAIFSVTHPSKEVRGTMALPQRYVTLQLNENLNGQAVYYKPNGSHNYVQVEESNITQVNNALWQSTGNAYAYTEGMCYFSIPIRHLGWYEDPDNAANANNPNATINWENVKPGYFGLVRNHVYTLGVDRIEGLATGLYGADNPIVPPMRQDSYYIKYRLNILNWRVVGPQTGIIL